MSTKKIRADLLVAQMLAQLRAIAAALNQEGEYEGARACQTALVVLDDFQSAAPLEDLDLVREDLPMPVLDGEDQLERSEAMLTKRDLNPLVDAISWLRRVPAFNGNTGNAQATVQHLEEMLQRITKGERKVISTGVEP